PLALLALWLAGCASFGRPTPPPHPRHIPPGERGLAYLHEVAAPLLTARLQAVRIADDEGERQARVTGGAVPRWVAFAKAVFRPAGVRFDFRPDDGDFVDRRSSAINRLSGDEQPDWPQLKAAANAMAAEYPDRLVVFFRHGPGAFATGG